MAARPWVESLVAVGLTLAGSEVVLRAVGLGPWHRFETFEAVPRLSDPDSELGWVNRPGEYRFTIGGRTIEVSHGELGSRGPPGVAEGAPEIGFFGDSYLYGFGLSDDEVVTSVLAAARPDLAVTNLAVPGYGTLQSVLLHQRGTRYDTVVYGLDELHDGRNAAAWSWLHALERSARHQEWTRVPPAWWNGDELLYGEPFAYSHWEWSERSAVVNRAELAWIGVHDRFLRTKSETTVQLVLRFREEVEARGSRFLVALLDAPERDGYYLRRLAEEDVDVLDLRHPNFPEWAIPGDGHPDSRVHRDWARSFSEVL